MSYQPISFEWKDGVPSLINAADVLNCTTDQLDSNIGIASYFYLGPNQFVVFLESSKAEELKSSGIVG